MSFFARWESGNPSPEIYHLLRTKFTPGTLFHRLYLEDDKQPSLGQWFSRLLDRHNWTIRKTTVYQKVPANWIEIAQLDSARICEVMRAAGVEVLINADQTFLRSYPEVDRVLAPVGSKRVKPTIKMDDKKGCTLMCGMEMFTSSLLPVFIALTGAYQGRLAKSWAQYPGS